MVVNSTKAMKVEVGMAVRVLTRFEEFELELSEGIASLARRCERKPGQH
jgi:hypothetical protein